MFIIFSEGIVSIVEAFYVLLFVMSLIFNFRSARHSLYVLIGFAIALNQPGITEDIHGFFLAIAGMILANGLIIWSWLDAWLKLKYVWAEPAGSAPTK